MNQASRRRVCRRPRERYQFFYFRTISVHSVQSATLFMQKQEYERRTRHNFSRTLVWARKEGARAGQKSMFSQWGMPFLLPTPRARAAEPPESRRRSSARLAHKKQYPKAAGAPPRGSRTKNNTHPRTDASQALRHPPLSVLYSQTSFGGVSPVGRRLGPSLASQN